MSSLQTAQVKITLPNELYFYVKSKAQKFGLPMASYVKNLIINDVKDVDIPIFKMSKHREKIVLKALADNKKGKTRAVKDLDSYFDSL
jgi:hypothetical protein